MKRGTLLVFLLGLQMIGICQVPLVSSDPSAGRFLAIKGDLMMCAVHTVSDEFPFSIPVEVEVGIRKGLNLSAYGRIEVMPVITTRLEAEAGLNKYFSIDALNKNRKYCGIVVGAAGVYGSDRDVITPTAKIGPLTRNYSAGFALRGGYQHCFANRIILSFSLDYTRTYEWIYDPGPFQAADRGWEGTIWPHLFIGFNIAAENEKK